MKVRYTQAARVDLEAIYDYISEHDPAAARRVKARIKERAERLGDLPYMGRTTETQDVRVLTVGRYPYKIFYKVRTADILVLHIRHSARQNPWDDAP